MKIISLPVKARHFFFLLKEIEKYWKIEMVDLPGDYGFYPHIYQVHNVFFKIISESNFPTANLFFLLLSCLVFSYSFTIRSFLLMGK